MKYTGGMYMKISGKEAYSVMLSDSPDIMNIEEMCSALSISKKMGYKLLREGKIVGMKVGRTYRVPKVHVLSYLKIVDENPAK
jgi:excisionase family DNA binding protein